MKRNQKELHRFSYETEIIQTPSNQAEKLIKEFNLNVTSGEYATDGTWYQLPKSYPTVLFDLYGYIIISSHRLLETLPYIHITKYINIHEGIHILSDYQKYKHEPKSIQDYDKIMEIMKMKEEEKQKQFLKFNNIMKSYIKNWKE